MAQEWQSMTDHGACVPFSALDCRYYMSHYLLFARWIIPFPGLPIPQSGTPRRLADMGCLSVHIEPQQLMHHGEFGIAAARSLVR